MEILKRSPDIELLTTASSGGPDVTAVFSSYGPDVGFDMAATRDGLVEPGPRLPDKLG
jgi:hypothetical protein